MSRIVIQAYGPSNSAKALAEYTGFKRLLTSNSKFRGRPSDIIINWGLPKTIHNSIYLNPIAAVKHAINKKATFNILQDANVSTPKVVTNKSDLAENTTYFARTTLTGHSGEGIIVFNSSTDSIPDAPLYTEAISKKAEYRVIVVNGQAVDIKQKKKKLDFEGERSPYVWNVANGYIMARNNITYPDSLPQLGIDAVNALGLKYGAVDIIMNSSQNLYVLEVNTSFGLEGTTIQLVGDAIKQLIGETTCAG